MKSDATGGDLDGTGIKCPNVRWIQPRVRQVCNWSQQTTHLGFYSSSQKPCLYKGRTSWFGRDLDNMKLHHKLTLESCPEGYTKQSLWVQLLALTTCPVTMLFLLFLPLPTVPRSLATPRTATKISVAWASAEVRGRALFAVWRCTQQKFLNCCLLLPIDLQTCWDSLLIICFNRHIVPWGLN